MEEFDVVVRVQCDNISDAVDIMQDKIDSALEMTARKYTLKLWSISLAPPEFPKKKALTEPPKEGFIYTGETFRGKKVYVRASELNLEVDTTTIFTRLGGYTHNGSQTYIRTEDVD